MHITTQKDYISWIESVISDPFLYLPQFCDWLDENNIRSQKYREILSMLDKTIWMKQYDHLVSLVTKQRYISIALLGKKKMIWLRIHKRGLRLSDKYLKAHKFKNLRETSNERI